MMLSSADGRQWVKHKEMIHSQNCKQIILNEHEKLESRSGRSDCNKYSSYNCMLVFPPSSCLEKALLIPRLRPMPEECGKSPLAEGGARIRSLTVLLFCKAGLMQNSHCTTLHCLHENHTPITDARVCKQQPITDQCSAAEQANLSIICHHWLPEHQGATLIATHHSDSCNNSSAS